MISTAVKYCLVSLLNQEVAVQAKEIEVFLSDDVSGAQLYECIRRYDDETSDTMGSIDSGEMVALGTAGKAKAIRGKKKNQEEEK